MAKSQPPNRQLISGRAARLAFKIGQAVDSLLIDRAFELAKRAAPQDSDVIVTTEHVRLAIDESLIVEACASVGVEFHGQTVQESQEAAA